LSAPTARVSYFCSPEGIKDAPWGTVQDFYDENPVHLLVQRLDGGAFERGLPLALSPDFVALFRTLLKDRKLEIQGEIETGDGTAVLKCHRRGWIHATMIPGGVRCFPLHSMKRVFPGSFSLGTICPVFLPSSSCLSRSSPSLSRLTHDSHTAMLVLHPRTHPKHNTRMNSIVLFWQQHSGMFVSLLSNK